MPLDLSAATRLLASTIEAVLPAKAVRHVTHLRAITKFLARLLHYIEGVLINRTPVHAWLALALWTLLCSHPRLVICSAPVWAVCVGFDKVAPPVVELQVDDRALEELDIVKEPPETPNASMLHASTKDIVADLLQMRATILNVADRLKRVLKLVVVRNKQKYYARKSDAVLAERAQLAWLTAGGCVLWALTGVVWPTVPLVAVWFSGVAVLLGLRDPSLHLAEAAVHGLLPHVRRLGQLKPIDYMTHQRAVVLRWRQEIRDSPRPVARARDLALALAHDTAAIAFAAIWVPLWCLLIGPLLRLAAHMRASYQVANQLGCLDELRDEIAIGNGNYGGPDHSQGSNLPPILLPILPPILPPRPDLDQQPPLPPRQRGS